MTTPVLRTDRLLLRGWRHEDRDAFAEMNADPEVMEHFPATLTRAESDAFVDRIEQHFNDHNFGFWAVEADGRFIGFTGLSVLRFHASWMEHRERPVVDVGWRLARSERREVVSLTVVGNLRSRAVMERLGMREFVEYDQPVEGHASLPSVCYLASRLP